METTIEEPITLLIICIEFECFEFERFESHSRLNTNGKQREEKRRKLKN